MAPPTDRLYMALRNREPIAVVKRLVESTPPSLLSLDELMAEAYRSGSSSSVFRLLIEASTPTSFPASLDDHCIGCDEEDFGEDTPLHLVHFLNHVPLDKLELIMDKHPALLARTNPKGRTPLHMACLLKHDTEKTRCLIRTMIGRYPEALAHADCKSSALPLHLACQYQPLDVVQSLVELYPDAVYCRNRLGDTPLHVACLYRSYRTVQYLLEHYPDSVAIANSFGDTPLHMACWRRIPVQVLETMLAAATSRGATSAMSAVNLAGNSILHLACNQPSLPIHVFDRMVQAWPVAALLLNQNGQSPLDVLQINRAGEEKIKLVDGATREALRAILGCVRKSDRCANVISLLKSAICGILDQRLEGWEMVPPSTLAQALQYEGEIQAILGLPELQGSVLREKTYQDLLCGAVAMNHFLLAGRSKNDAAAAEQGGVAVLRSVIHNPSCLWLHLRENPLLVVGGTMH